jgi:hypothetical protein
MRRQLQPAAEPAIQDNREPSIKELLAEPVVRALMKADGVDPEDVKALLHSSAASPGDGALRKARSFGKVVDARDLMGGRAL